MEAVALNPGRLVAAAVIGLVLLLVLIIKFKVQAMVAILIGAIAIGLLVTEPLYHGHSQGLGASRDLQDRAEHGSKAH